MGSGIEDPIESETPFIDINEHNIQISAKIIPVLVKLIKKKLGTLERRRSRARKTIVLSQSAYDLIPFLKLSSHKIFYKKSLIYKLRIDSKEQIPFIYSNACS